MLWLAEIYLNHYEYRDRRWYEGPIFRLVRAETAEQALKIVEKKLTKDDPYGHKITIDVRTCIHDTIIEES